MNESGPERQAGQERVSDLVNRRQLLVRGGGAVAALGVIPFLSACGGSLGDDDETTAGGKTIGFSFLYSEVPAAAPLKDFARERGDQVGYEVLTDNIRAGKVDEQISSIESFITRKVDAIVAHVTDPSSYSAIIKRSDDAGIPFFAYATAVPGSDGAVLFPFDEAAKQLSADAADWINQNLDGEGQVLVLAYTGDPLGAAASKLLGDGITAKTNATVVAEQDALEQATGLRVTEDALKANPEINVVVAWNDGGALGASKALEKVGKDPAKVYIGSNEGTQEAVQAMLQGNEYIKAINLLSLKKLGYGIVDLPRRFFATEKKQDLVVGRPLIHAGETAKLKAALKEY